jgi:hypothetical protein
VLASRIGRNHNLSQHIMGSTRSQCLTCIRSWCSSCTFPRLFSQSSARLHSGRSNMAVKAFHMVATAIILATYRCCWAYKVEKFSLLMPNVTPYRVSTNHITGIVTVMWDIVCIRLTGCSSGYFIDQGFPYYAAAKQQWLATDCEEWGCFPIL